MHCIHCFSGKFVPARPYIYAALFRISRTHNLRLNQSSTNDASVCDKLPCAELQTIVRPLGAVLSHSYLPVARRLGVWVGHVRGAVVTPHVPQLLLLRVLPLLASFRLDAVFRQQVGVVLYRHAQS